MDFEKAINDNLIARENLLIQADRDVLLQKDLNDQCAEDTPFFINHFVWTWNPTARPFNFNFLLYPKQEEIVLAIIDEIDRGIGNLIEKSRETGATYLVLAVILNLWLYRKGFEAMLLSLKEAEVDDKTPSSLFGKLVYMVERLPRWMLPKRFKWRLHSKFLFLKNPTNNATIIGRATTPDAGRSARKSVVMVDEEAGLSHRIADGLEMNLRHVTRSIIRISTPRGINLFKQIRDKGTVPVHTLHWTQIPPKCVGLYYRNDDGDSIQCENLAYDRRSKYGYYIHDNGKISEYRLRSIWYDTEERDALNHRHLAQEVDIAYIGSGFCRFNEHMIEEKANHCEPGIRGKLVNKGDKKNYDIQFVESKPGQDYELEMWEKPQKTQFLNHAYCGVDTAEGKEDGDFDSADIIIKNFDGETRTLAASLYGLWPPDVFADKLNLLGRWYNARMCVELNKDGLGIALRLLNQLRYPYMYFDSKGDPGFRTTKQNKYTITGDLDETLRMDETEVKSLSHFTEMSTFISKDEKLGADAGKNDDKVISLSIANFVANKYGRPILKKKQSQGFIKNTLRSNKNSQGY